MPRGGILAALQRVESGESEFAPENQVVEVEENESVEAEAPEVEETPTSQTPGPPSLSDRLRQFGYKNSLPEELPEEANSIIEEILSLSDERVRGFQSVITQGSQELARDRQALGAKAQAFDALQSDPMYQKFIKAYQEGKIPEDTEELDLSKLPTEPLERFKALSKHSVNPELEALRNELKELRNWAMNQENMTTWERFKSEHSDAESLMQGIGENMARGMDLQTAYEAVRAKNFDPDAERQRILEEVQASVKSLKKTGAVATRTSKASTQDVSPEQLSKMSRREKLFHYLENAEREVLGGRKLS